MKLRVLTLTVFLAFFCLFLFPIDSSHSAAAFPVVTMGYPQPSGAMLPIWVMSYARLDQKYGFNLQNIYISGGPASRSRWLPAISIWLPQEER
jgi:hypothetical protein